MSANLKRRKRGGRARRQPVEFLGKPWALHFPARFSFFSPAPFSKSELRGLVDVLGADLSLVHWVQRREDDLQGQNLVTAPHLRLPELEEGRLLVNLMGDVVEATDRAGLLDIELLDLDE